MVGRKGGILTVKDIISTVVIQTVLSINEGSSEIWLYVLLLGGGGG